MAAKKIVRKVAVKKPIRTGVRFPPDPGTLAQVQFELAKGSDYGLVLNESSGGCAIVLSCESKISEQASCMCKIGNLPFTPATVRWVKKLEKNLYKVGLKYLL